MVKRARDLDLDLVFHALAAETRRSILEDLADGPRTVTELAVPHAMSLPAVSKHIRVLEQAGLVARSREGRVHRMSVRAAPLAAAVGWLEQYRMFWEERFDALARLVEAEPKRTGSRSRRRTSKRAGRGKRKG